MSKSKNKQYHNPNMVRYDAIIDRDFGYFCRAYFKHIKEFAEFSKPAQKVVIGILGILDNPSNDEIKEEIGFMPWEGKFNLTQADMARKFNLDRRCVSKGIKELKQKRILIEHNNIFYLNPTFFSHQDYFSKETYELFRIAGEKAKEKKEKLAF